MNQPLLGILRTSILLLSLVLIALPVFANAQERVLGERWIEVQSDNFHIYSQLSSRQTIRFAEELEVWRQVAAFSIAGIANFPKANVPNYVYLFDDSEALQAFVVSNESAFFSPTPRSNFMALAINNEDSISLAVHHYAHFLLRNFSDLRLPRWYEEGIAGYIARMQLDGSEVEFDRFRQVDNEMLAGVSESLSMDRLLYSDAALASPRMIQIANLKSVGLLHYLRHAYEEEGFIDRREQLENYLMLLLEGRNPRYAFDRSFDVTTTQLDDEFHQYLLNSSRPPGVIQVGVLRLPENLASKVIADARLALALAELALNSGSFEVAQRMFEATIDNDANAARGLSGLGDSLRMQELDGLDQRIAAYFIDAVELAPNDANILLDYGEHWEAELGDCENRWPVGQKNSIVSDVFKYFEQALALNPQSPEANLAMGQYYLIEGNDWQLGKVFQEKAFQLLPADTFIMEQAVRYAIAADHYEEAERLIAELAQPTHYYGEADWVTDLRERLLRKRRNEIYSECD